MKVAIVHYWLVGMRGGEKVVEALCDLFPQADIFTHVYAADAVSEKIRGMRVKTTFINSLPRSRHLYKKYLPLMPIALEQLDLRDYDLVISSEAGPAKGILPPPAALHLCYCHSPMRYIWNMYHEYRETTGTLTRAVMPLLAHYLRAWDVAAVARVDRYVANSRTVATRIHRYWGRDAEIIHPPVDTEAFELVDESEIGNYWLMAGELVAYKRPDLAVEAFNRMRAPLVVIGGGPLLSRIREIAGPTVTVMGPQPFAVLRQHYSRCRALIFPGEEDFGIVPVEAMASGRPVIAYGRGGATESVVPNLTGLFFEEQKVEAIVEAVQTASRTTFDPRCIAAHARRFGVARFKTEMSNLIDELLDARIVRTSDGSPAVAVAAQ